MRRVAPLLLALAACSPSLPDDSPEVADDELVAALDLERTLDLPLGAPFDRGEGLHDQAYAFDGAAHFSAGVTTAHEAWVFVHDADGALACSSKLEDPFGAASTGKVHAGGGVLDGGALLVAVSNEVDGPEGAVALARVERPAPVRAARDRAPGASAAACAVTWLPVDGRGGRHAVVGAYVGLVTEATVRGEAALVLLDIHGASALRYDRAAGALRPTTQRPAGRSGIMPQQCARLGRELLCTPLPLAGGLALSVVDPAIGDDGALSPVGKRGFGALRAPLGEGIAVHDGRIWIAGNAGLGQSAGCGFAGLAMPCSTRQGTQRVYVYRPR